MGKYIEYYQHESGVHEYIWLESRREAIAEHLPIMKYMNESAMAGQTIRILHDFGQSGAPPFLLLSRRLPEMRIRDDVSYRVAYIMDYQTRLLMENFEASIAYQSDGEFFDIKEREPAISWLLEE